jgi:cation:H+ antiporter
VGFLLALAVVGAVLALVLYSKLRYFRYFANVARMASKKKAALFAGPIASIKGNLTGGSAAGAAVNSVWSFPLLIFSALIIAWGAEVGQFIVSQGMCLAILAWLQVLPEFAVEAVISREAALDPSMIHLITANFTGSNRLLVGLGWPLIYFTTYLTQRQRKYRKGERFTGKETLALTMMFTSLIGAFVVGFVVPDWHLDFGEYGKVLLGQILFVFMGLFFLIFAYNCRIKYQVILERMHSVEVVALLVPSLYFFIIWAKGTLTLIDSAILLVMYLVYLWILNRLPPEDMEKACEMHDVPEMVLKKSRAFQIGFVLLMFLIGGAVLYFVAEPFLDSMLGLAILAGISPFIFVQWVAPFMSEFPEKVSAFYWARTIRHAPMAMMNMISSKINQWTILISMIPMVFCITLWQVRDVPFDEFQRWEIILTIAQTIFAVSFLLKMRLTMFDAVTLFFLWFVQFAIPLDIIRHTTTVIYFVGAFANVLYYRNEIKVFSDFRHMWNEHIKSGRTRACKRPEKASKPKKKKKK